MDMRSAQEYLHAVRMLSSGREIVYTRGSDSKPLVSIVGATSANVASDDGMMVRKQARDFIIETKTMTFGNGLPITPQAGDEIRYDDPDRDDMVVCRVAPMQAGESVWRWTDETRRWVRIHTQEIDSEAQL